MDEPTRISATEFSKEVGRFSDLALTQAVVITRNGRDRNVMISAEEYGRLKRRDRRVYGAGELPEAMLEAVGDAEVDQRHHQLDRLLDDWTP